MTDGRTKAVGWRKAALASGRRRRVEFIMGSAGVSALLQRSNGCEKGPRGRIDALDGGFEAREDGE
jgi:hypothetical protein